MYLILPQLATLIPISEITNIVETAIRLSLLALMIPILGETADFFARHLSGQQDRDFARSSISVGGYVVNSILISGNEARVMYDTASPEAPASSISLAGESIEALPKPKAALAAEGETS
jgi:hypothetical protein